MGVVAYFWSGLERYVPRLVHCAMAHTEDVLLRGTEFIQDHSPTPAILLLEHTWTIRSGA